MQASFTFEITHSNAALVEDDDIVDLTVEQFEAARRIVPGCFPGHAIPKKFSLKVDVTLTDAEIAALVEAAQNAEPFKVGHGLGYSAEFYRTKDGAPAVYYAEGSDEISLYIENGAIVDYNADDDVIDCDA